MANLVPEALATIELTVRGLWMRGLKRRGRRPLVGGMSGNIMAFVPMLRKQVGVVED